MATFAENTWFFIEDCCNCGMQFAMTSDFQKRRSNDQKTFYCPAGHPQHYTGPSEAQKLKDALARKEEMLHAAELRAEKANAERTEIARAHKKMRIRVMNGVCPCCNRTFQNLMSHMKNEHPEFTEIKTLSVLREAFGMTQGTVAREAGVKSVYVSMYEREKPIPAYAKERLDYWIASHNNEKVKA